jgi:hypothetical protein
VWIGGIGQGRNCRPDDQHGHGSGAHDEHEAAEGPVAALAGRSIVGGNQVSKDLDAGHHGQHAGKAPKGEVKVVSRKSLPIDGRQMESLLPDGGADHGPQQEQDPGCGRAMMTRATTWKDQIARTRMMNRRVPLLLYPSSFSLRF